MIEVHHNLPVYPLGFKAHSTMIFREVLKLKYLILVERVTPPGLTLLSSFAAMFSTVFAVTVSYIYYPKTSSQLFVLYLVASIIIIIIIIFASLSGLCNVA
ncbi:hypothetical protein EV421DRAFT_1828240 [Armillaria borealis]|uniref:Transmembrane protein n=1 Tax=Armillaria borealis TaxID=47425 RepID=A0AA39JBB5_9AGAR|nr:hypothetical protein EV421DRAFT_1828240 [Armillaria borealis]